MITKLLGMTVGEKAYAPPPFDNHPVTIVGFRYHTSRNTGRTYMVADYVTHDGKASFDAIERMTAIEEEPLDPMRGVEFPFADNH